MATRAQSNTRHRAPKACLRCRARKVRCDVFYRGCPCTNCTLDGETCVVTKKKRYRDAKSTPTASPSAQDHSTLFSSPEEPILFPLEMAKDKLAQGPPSSSPRNLNRETGIFDLTHGLTPPQGNCITTNDKADSPGDQFSAAHQDTPTAWQASIHCRVVYLSYSFLTINNYSNIPSQDLNFLAMQGCLHVPPRGLLDEFTQQYFLHIHPFLPLVNEDEFWEIYYPSTDGLETREKMPLLVCQAMLFAACNIVSHSTIEALGYPSIRAARCDFYRRAKLLYDLETEISPVCLAQAALLLSLRAPLCNRTPDTWLSFAIHHARSVDAHRYATLSSSPPYTGQVPWQRRPNLLKKIWWCCIIRDRTLSLLMRRPIQIVSSYMESNPKCVLGVSDLQHEFEHSRVYSPETKKAIAVILAKLIELYIIMAKVLMIVYPGDIASEPKLPPKAADQDYIRECKASLRQWYKVAILKFPPLRESHLPKKATDLEYPHHDSEILYENLMFMYYHCSCMALSHYDILQMVKPPSISESAGVPAITLSEGLSIMFQNRQELESAVLGVTERVVELVRLDLARWLPISAVACIAFPLFLNILDITLSGTGKDLVSEAEANTSRALKQYRLNSLIKFMRIYHQQYDGIDWVSKIIRHVLGLATTDRLAFHACHDASVREWTDILSLQPELYLSLALAIDISFSKERLPEEADLPMILRSPVKRDTGASPQDPIMMDHLAAATAQHLNGPCSYFSTPTLSEINASHDADPGLDLELISRSEPVADDVRLNVFLITRPSSPFTSNDEPKATKGVVEKAAIEQELRNNINTNDPTTSDHDSHSIFNGCLEMLWDEAYDQIDDLDKTMVDELRSILNTNSI
ncbi:fungal-specific transcription factor domain-containing protein [Xylariales sp. PMI_506]|nr:fungal-specific transcription factor domain-containing protein [Xylariales sp. PMI_506]